MLIAALITCILIYTHGRSSELTLPFRQAEEHIKKDVADDGRRTAALSIVGRMQQTIQAIDKDRQNAPTSLRELLDKRTTSSTEIESALQPLKAGDEENCERLLDLRFELKGVLTAEEWKQVFPAPVK
jgi:hypothetical protein